MTGISRKHNPIMDVDTLSHYSVYVIGKQNHNSQPLAFNSVSGTIYEQQ